MSSKSAVKVLAPAADGGLFRWVAALTGSKNAVKGLGFFLGAAMLGLAGFQAAVWGMAAVLAAIFVAVVLFLPAGLPGRVKAAEGWSGWRSRDSRVNRLSLARMFLFGARDVWFVVGIPIYFQAVLSDGTAEGRREAFFLVGGFMALWIILYGAVQAAAPRILGGAGRPEAQITRDAVRWAGRLVPIPFAMAAAVVIAGDPAPWLTMLLVLGLLVFGFDFAVNSSVHSYLILAFGQAQRITQDVGFYYMANAAGPPDRDAAVGPVLSGRRAAAVPGHRRRDGGGQLVGGTPSADRQPGKRGAGPLKAVPHPLRLQQKTPRARHGRAAAQEPPRACHPDRICAKRQSGSCGGDDLGRAVADETAARCGHRRWHPACASRTSRGTPLPCPGRARL